MKHEIDFGGEPPFKQGAYVDLNRGQGTLTLSTHDHACFNEPLVIPVTSVLGERDRVWRGQYPENPGKNCEDKTWTVYVFRIQRGGKPRLYGVHYPTDEDHLRPRSRQSSGVWGADE